MESGIVLFLGMVRRGEFESLQEHHLPLGIIIDTNSKARLGDVSGFAVVEHFDFSRPLPELIDAVRDVQRRFGLACLLNLGEFYVRHTAEVAAALGVPGLSPAAARLCQDKNLMRARFRDRLGARIPPRFCEVTSEPELLEAARNLGYPVFLQPSNVSASMWATRNQDPQSLLQHYHAMLRDVPAYYQRLGQGDRTLSVVLAEFLDGPNASVDCLIDSGGKTYTTPVVDALTGRDIGIDDFHHFARLLPSRLSPADQAELTRLAIAGCNALDMSNSAAHVEFIGRRLGEIGARPGGNRPRILEMAYGMDLLYAYYQVLRGQPPELRATRDLSAAIVTPFARRNGTLRSIRHLDQVVKLHGYLYHEIRAQPGQQIGLSKSGYRAGLYIELSSEDAGEIRRSVDEIASWTDLYEIE